MKVFVLVQGRRPLHPCYLEDENDGEYLFVLTRAYQYIRKQGISPRQIYVLTTERESDCSCFPEAVAEKRILTSSPNQLLTLLESIYSPGVQLFLHFVSHGGTDKIGEVWDTIEKDKRGLSWYVQQRQERDRWWLYFPYPSQCRISHCASSIDFTVTTNVYRDWENPDVVDITDYTLHWQVLMKSFVTAFRLGKLENLVVVGCACYSGGLFQWLPEHSLDIEERENKVDYSLTLKQVNDIFPDEDAADIIQLLSTLPFYAITSSDEEIMAGTWFWYEWWRTLELLSDENNMELTLDQVYRIMHRKDPRTEYDLKNPQSRGSERIDSLVVSQFYGNSKSASMKLSDVFSP